MEELGAIHPETLNQAYSRMSGLIDSKRVFIFWGVRTPKNIIEALAMELEGYLIETSFTVKNKPFRFG